MKIIGTFEDWYFIIEMKNNVPVHFNMINNYLEFLST